MASNDASTALDTACQTTTVSATTTTTTTSLRAELKEWERAFAAANGGKRASREDIKKHPDIGMRNRQAGRQADR